MNVARRSGDPAPACPEAPGATPLPDGFRVELDPAAKELEPGLWYGGGRVLRLTPSGRDAWAALRVDGVTDRATGRLARRLTDAGLAHPLPPATTDDPDVTVIIPVHDRPEALERCLAALGRRYPAVIVDDASPDELRTRAIAHRHGARIVRLDVNAGPAGARNAGLVVAQTEFVAFLDSDTVPGPGWIRALAAYLADPALAAVAPRVVPLVPTPFGTSLDLGASRANVVPYGRVSYVPSAALLVRRSAIDGFDATMRTGEDVDLVWRLLAAGWRVRYEPGEQVPHEEPALWERVTRRHAYGRAAAPLALRHPRHVAPLAVRPWYAATVAALLARRPVLAATTFAAAVVTTRTPLRRAGVPTHGLLPAVADGVRQTGLGAGRYAAQFAPPLAAFGWGRVLVLAPSLAAWWPRRREVDPLRFVLVHLAGELAYGSGVLAGCVRHRTTRPLRPKIVKRGSS